MKQVVGQTPVVQSLVLRDGFHPFAGVGKSRWQGGDPRWPVYWVASDMEQFSIDGDGLRRLTAVVYEIFLNIAPTKEQQNLQGYYAYRRIWDTDLAQNAIRYAAQIANSWSVPALEKAFTVLVEAIDDQAKEGSYHHFRTNPYIPVVALFERATR